MSAGQRLPSSTSATLSARLAPSHRPSHIKVQGVKSIERGHTARRRQAVCTCRRDRRRAAAHPRERHKRARRRGHGCCEARVQVRGKELERLRDVDREHRGPAWRRCGAACSGRQERRRLEDSAPGDRPRLRPRRQVHGVDLRGARCGAPQHAAYQRHPKRVART